MMLRKFTLMVALLIAATSSALPAMAQEYPKKQPIKIVVAHPPGGLADAATRIMAEFLQKRLGQAVITENRAGAAGTIGADFVFKAPADGYTLFMAESSFAQVPAVRDNLSYKIEDFTYLVRSLTLPPLILVGPKVPVSTIPELVAFMKANPGKARYGTTGIGGPMHLGQLMFENSAGVKGAHIPYTGVGPAVIDLLAGTIELVPGGVVPFPEGVKPIGSAGTVRHVAFPNLPTLDEAGIKNASWNIWQGFMAPPNLPKPIADRLIAEISAVLKDPEAIARYQAAGKVVPETNLVTGEAFKNDVLEAAKNWKAVVAREKIVVPQ
jgi:tripartite-type tricarboxylate transporter receptor subunit TctC